MYKIKEAVIVEGTYDKIKLSSFLDGVIFVTGGFSVISNKKRLTTIKTLAEEMGYWQLHTELGKYSKFFVSEFS